MTLATGMRLLRDGDMGLVRGLYSLCPHIAGRWPQERFPSSIENERVLLNLYHNRGAVAYGIEQLDAENPLAWPSFATDADVWLGTDWSGLMSAEGTPITQAVSQSPTRVQRPAVRSGTISSMIWPPLRTFWPFRRSWMSCAVRRGWDLPQLLG